MYMCVSFVRLMVLGAIFELARQNLELGVKRRSFEIAVEGLNFTYSLLPQNGFN